MKKKIIVPMLIAFSLLTIASIETPGNAAEQTVSQKELNMYNNFMLKLLQPVMTKAVKNGYKSSLGRFGTGTDYLHITEKHAILTLTYESDLNSEVEIRNSLPHIVNVFYSGETYRDWIVKKIAPLTTPHAKPYYDMVVNRCGKNVADQTWFVELQFPKLLPSASMSQGRIFVSKTHKGWVGLFRYP